MGTCTFHPSKSMDGICLRCNSGICRDCICEFRGRPYCTRCILTVNQSHGIFRQTLVWVGIVTLLTAVLGVWSWWGLSGLKKQPAATSTADSGAPPTPDQPPTTNPPPTQGKAPPPLSPEDKQKLEALRKGCEQDRGDDCRKFAFLVIRSPEPLRYQLALRALQQACRLKDGEGCAELAQMFHLGLGVQRNYPMAVQFYQRSCQLNNKGGCTNLGILTVQGLGTTKDGAKGLQLFEKACKMGSAVGCRNVGIAWFKGLAGSKNMRKARRAFQLACKRKDGASCMRLSTIFQKGLGVRANAAQAKRWRQRACKLGISEACD